MSEDVYLLSQDDMMKLLIKAKREHEVRIAALEGRKQAYENQEEGTIRNLNTHNNALRTRVHELTMAYEKVQDQVVRARDQIRWMAQTVHQAHHGPLDYQHCPNELCKSTKTFLGVA